MRQLSLLRLGIVILVLLLIGGGVWFVISKLTTSQSKKVATNQTASIVGVLAELNGQFSVFDESKQEPIYVANSHDIGVTTILEPLVGQTIVATGELSQDAVYSLSIESVNNQSISGVSPTSTLMPGIRDVFANLRPSQQNCLTSRLDPQAFSKLVTEPAYQLTPAESITLEMCLNQAQ